VELTPEVIKYVEKLRLDDDTRQDLYVHLLERDISVEKGFPKYVYEVYKNLKRNNQWIERNRIRLRQDNEEEIRKNTVGHRETDDPMDILLGLEEMELRIAKLSPLVKSSMEKYWIDGMTPAAIAEEEGVPEGAIRQRLTRGRKELEYE
jgi:RNA polymerase sigma factor (sigma-70 family)